MSKEKKTSVCIALIVVLYCLTIIATVMGYMAYSAHEEVLCNIQANEHSPSSGQTCHISNCSNRPTNHVFFSLKHGDKKNATFSIPNKASFNINTGSFDSYKDNSYYAKDEYLVITPQGNGNYIAQRETAYNKKHFTTYNGKIYYTSFSGIYCDTHVNEAISTVQSEISRTFNKNLLYLWGCTLTPYNVILIFALALIPMFSKWSARKAQMIAAHEADMKRGFYPKAAVEKNYKAFRKLRKKIILSSVYVLTGLVLTIIGITKDSLIDKHMFTLLGCLAMLPFAVIPDRIIVIRMIKKTMDALPIKDN